jgi:SAM-dependent methyltransferase
MELSSLQDQYVSAVNERIVTGQYRMEYESCPCGADDADVISQVDRYGLVLDTVLCTTCGTLRFDPYLSGESLADFYRNYYQEMYARAQDADAYFVRQRGYGERLKRLVHRMLPPGAVVAEVGCGAGGALSVFREAGYDTHGCDYSARLIEFGLQRGTENLHFGDIEELTRSMASTGKKADLIFLHHVFEHIPSPVTWLVTAQRILAQNGVIVIAVPDVSAIHRYPSPNGDLRLFLHIAHKFNFSLGGLAALAKRAEMNSSLVGVEKSDQAPEVWVAFARAELPGDRLDAFSGGSSRSLFRRLRLIELDYVRRGVLRKIAKLADGVRARVGNATSKSR